MSTHKNVQIYDLSQNYWVWLNKAPKMKIKTISDWPLCITVAMAESSLIVLSKRGLDSLTLKVETHSVFNLLRTNYIEKLILEIPTKIYLTDLFLYYFFFFSSISQWNSTSGVVFVKVLILLFFCQMQISAASKLFFFFKQNYRTI